MNNKEIKIHLLSVIEYIEEFKEETDLNVIKAEILELVARINNPDLPDRFIKDCIQAKLEVERGLIAPYQRRTEYKKK